MRGPGALLVLAALAGALWLLSRPTASTPALPERAGQGTARHVSAELDADQARTDRRPAVAKDGAEDAPGTGPFAGVLLQEETGEPLPWYHLAVYAGGRRFDLKTDARGRFVQAIPPGDLRVVFHDTPRDPRARPTLAAGVVLPTSGGPPSVQVPHERGGSTHGLRVSSGPTFLLELERPPDLPLARLRAVLRLDRPHAQPFWMGEHAARLRDDGGELWVRFPPHPQGVRDGPWGVTVRSVDDGWISGEAQVPQGLGLFQRPLRLRLLPRGGLRVRALCDGVQEDLPVWPSLEPVGKPGQEVLDEVLYVRPGEPLQETSGSWLFTGLEVGQYRLEFDSTRHRPYSAEIEVVAGELSEHGAALQRLPIGGTVSGTLITETGDARPAEQVTLVAENSERQFVARVEWIESGGRLVGRFQLKDLPAARYWLAPAARTLHAWQPEGLWIDPPTEGVEFLCHNGGEHAPIGFLVTDARTGATLDELHLTLRRRADAPDRGMHTPLTSGQPIHVRFPLSAPVEWTVSRAGYHTALGTGEAFTERRDTSHGEGRFARVALEPEE